MPYAVIVAPFTGPLTAVPLIVPLLATGVVALLPPPPHAKRSERDPIKRVSTSVVLRFLKPCINVSSIF
jgi:hypothetical protein